MPRPVCVDRGLPCGIWSCLGWKGGVDEAWPGQWVKKVLVSLRVLGVICRKEHLRQGVVSLLGMAVVCCLGHASVSEETWH